MAVVVEDPTCCCCCWIHPGTVLAPTSVVEERHVGTTGPNVWLKRTTRKRLVVVVVAIVAVACRHCYVCHECCCYSFVLVERPRMMILPSSRLVVVGSFVPGLATTMPEVE